MSPLVFYGTSTSCANSYTLYHPLENSKILRDRNRGTTPHQTVAKPGGFQMTVTVCHAESLISAWHIVSAITKGAFCGEVNSKIC